MSSEDWLDNARIWFRDQPNSRLFIAAAIILGIGYVVNTVGFGSEYAQELSKDKRLSMLICEASRDWVLADPKRLKHGQTNLQDFKIDGKTIKLEHMDYPKVLFLDSGIRKIELEGGSASTANDLYCFFQEPRGGGKFYYNYRTREWVNKVRFRR